MDKRRVATALARRVVNPVMKPIAGFIPGWSLLETTGRRSGQARRTPVGDGLRGDVFWIVAEHGRGADYVRNIEVNPRVRIRVRGRWRTGTARVLSDDDARARQRHLQPINAALVRIMGTELLTIRVDLDRA